MTRMQYVAVEINLILWLAAMGGVFSAGDGGFARWLVVAGAAFAV